MNQGKQILLNKNLATGKTHMLIPVIAVLIIKYFAYLCTWLSISFQEIWTITKRHITWWGVTRGYVLGFLEYDSSFSHVDMVVDS